MVTNPIRYGIWRSFCPDSKQLAGINLPIQRKRAKNFEKYLCHGNEEKIPVAGSKR
jgi:hypothetical protein